MKRWRARARGRVNRIRKRTCHITLIVSESPKAAQSPKRKAEQARRQDAPAPAPAAEQKPKRRAPAKKKEVAA